MKILLKISWESLKWEKDFWIDPEYVENIVKIINDVKLKWHDLFIVVWWWNIYRWWDLIKSWVNASDSHSLSMLSTVFNWVVLKNFLEKKWLESEVLSPLWINFVWDYSKDTALKLLKDWKIVILTWWTWNPFFTTDSWAALRGLELGVDIMIKATRVDWVYNKDPEKHSDAEKIDKITYEEFLNKNLKALDQTAIVLAKENNLVIKVVNINKKWSIISAIESDNEWTIISN